MNQNLLSTNYISHFFGLPILLVGVLIFFSDCTNPVKDTDEEAEKLNETHIPYAVSEKNPPTSQKEPSSMKVRMDKTYEETTFSFTPTSTENKTLESSIVTPITQSKISSQEWEQTTELEWKQAIGTFLEETRKMVLNRPDVTASVVDNAFNDHRYTFQTYYVLYRLICNGQEHMLIKIKNDLNILLEPLGNFIVNFESLFDGLKTHYQNNSKVYKADMERLEKQIFPTIQKTFNTFMQVYTECSGEKLGMIGPLKNKLENLVMLHAGIKKHVFYKRDINGDFLLFTLYPHEEVGENLYQSYVPYLQNRNTNYVQDTIIFSLDGKEMPVIEEHSGLIVSKNDAGISIEPYRGSETSLPYTTSQTLILLNRDIQGRMVARSTILSAIEEELLYEESDEEERELDEEEREILKAIGGNIIPAALKGKSVGNRFKTIPTYQGTSIKKFVESVLVDNKERIFIPFPYTDLEETEVTYLYLLDLKRRLQEDNIQPADINLLRYLDYEDFSEPALDQTIQEYEEELVSKYAEEEEIRKEQEARRSMVARGELDQKPTTPKHKTSTKKKSGTSAQKGKVGEEQGGLQVQDINRNYTPSESSQAKAKKRLEKLRNAHKKGSVKFRKFMQLVNVASQGLTELDITTKAKLHKGSHGAIKVEGHTPQTIVRPHGGDKEKSVSSRSKNKILTSLVKTFMENLPKKSQ